MRLLFATLTLMLGFLGLANKASGAAQIGTSSFVEVCFDNKAFCSVLVIDRLKGTVHVNVYPTLGYNVPLDDDYGVKVQTVSAANYSYLKSAGMETLDLTMDQISEYYASNGVIDSIDKKIEREYDKCVWNTISCGTGLLGAMMTSGWALIPAAINCKLSRMACQDALAVKAQLEQLRLNELERIRQEEEAAKKEKDAANGGAPSGGGSGGSASTGGGQGGWFGPGASNPSRGGTVTITEAPPGPMPGAVGGGVGRRPILQ
jgi:hypothetical protein